MRDIPSLPYMTNSYGVDSRTTPRTVPRKRRSDGAFIANRTYTDVTAEHSRSGRTINHPRALSPGGPVFWRNPSSYSRFQGYVSYRESCNLIISSTEYLENSALHASILTGVYQNAFPGVPGPIEWYPGRLPNDRPNQSSFFALNLRRMADTKALNDLAGAKANLGEALATIRMTADLFIDTAIDLLRFIRGFRSGRLFREFIEYNPARTYDAIASGKLPRALANRWLQFHYGWKPLAQDVYGVYELLSEQLSSNQPLLVHGRGLGFGDSSDQKLCPSRLGSAIATGVDFSGKAMIGYVTNVTGSVQGSGISRAVNQAGLINPLSLTWELIPYSFVLDWIVPIGSVLTALSASAGLDFVGGSRTCRFYRRIEASSLPDSSMDGKSISRVIIESSGFDRTKLGDFPSPAPYVKPFYTGGDRWATIASLLTNIGSQFRGR